MNENEIENEFDFDDDELFKKQLQFELEYLKNTEWSVNKEQFKIYVACCEAMRKIAEASGGEVKTDYLTQMSGQNENFNRGIRRGDCSIIVPCVSLFQDTLGLFKGVLSYSANLGITPKTDGSVWISITIPDVYIDKGISI